MVKIKRKAGRRRLPAASVRANASSRSTSVRSIAPAAGGIAKGFANFGKHHPFPRNWRCPMVYTELQSIQTPAASNLCGTTYYLGLNALYDVYLAAGGHQPYGFDQLCSSSGPYYRYKVHAVKIRIEFFDPPSDTGLQVVCAVHNPVDYSAGKSINGLDITAISEKHNCWSSYISPTGAQSLVMEKYFPMHQLFNLTKSQIKNDINSTTGAYNSNPGSTPALEIGLLDVRGGAAVTLYAKISLTFYTQFYDRAQLTQS